MTYKRPELLERCLESLALLDSVAGWEREVIVVDNDPMGSAARAVKTSQCKNKLTLTYQSEPIPGIAAARNRCIGLAGAHEFLAFLDDDEVATPDWLAELLIAQQRWNADLVGGPVEPQFDRAPPRWVRDGGYFARSSRPPGLTDRGLATNNMLVRLTTLEDMGELFDNRYGLSGGSDAELSTRAGLMSKRLAWAPAAIVRERVQTGRLRRRWVLKRAFRVGNVHARIMLQHSILPGRAAVVQSAARTIVAAFLRFPGGVLRREPGHLLRTLRLCAQALGMVAGASGLRYLEYGRTREIWKPGSWRLLNERPWRRNERGRGGPA